MDNPETMAALSKKDTERRQTKQSKTRQTHTRTHTAQHKKKDEQ